MHWLIVDPSVTSPRFNLPRRLWTAFQDRPRSMCCQPRLLQICLVHLHRQWCTSWTIVHILSFLAVCQPCTWRILRLLSGLACRANAMKNDTEMELSVLGSKRSWNFWSWQRKCHGTFAPRSEKATELSMTFSLRRIKDPWHFSCREWNFCDIFALWSESFTCGSCTPMLPLMGNNIAVHLVSLHSSTLKRLQKVWKRVISKLNSHNVYAC